MPKGVYQKTEEHKRKIGRALRGITKKMNPNLAHSKFTKRKMSKRMMGNQNPLGNIHSEETKRKMSESAKGHIVSEITRKKIAKGHRGITKEINSNLIRSKEYKIKKSKAQQKKWDNPEYREKQLKTIFAARSQRPNKSEERLRGVLNSLFPKEYKYVGEGSFLIGFKNPDFVNVNGQKKIIELFGNYWHSKEKTGRAKKQEQSQRINHFTKYGYKTLIVWECELKNTKRLNRKLMEFHNA